MRRNRIRNLWNWYQKQWSILSGWRLFLLVAATYTFLFIIVQFGVFSALYASGASFVWNGDGISQHYPRLLYVCRTIHQTLKNLFSGKGLDFQLVNFHQGIVSPNLSQYVLPQSLVAGFSVSQDAVLDESRLKGLGRHPLYTLEDGLTRTVAILTNSKP